MLREATEEVGGAAAVEEEEAGSDVSGYHSDSDSAVMMSGNSPFVSKHARFNFLTRSGEYSALLLLFIACIFSTVTTN